jgi:tRNA(fMet)-specific endonuclease VapC
VIFLDTDVLTVFERRAGEAFQALADRLAQTPDQVYVAIINFEEQIRGWFAYIAASRTASREVEGYGRLLRLLEGYRERVVIGYDNSAAAKFAELRRARVRIGSMDLKLASIVLVHSGILVSRNLRDFRRVPGLRVEDWTLPE